MKKAIEILQEKVTEAAFYLDLDEVNVIVAAMEEYAQEQLKNCNLQNVSNNEVAVCDNCHKNPVLRYDQTTGLDLCSDCYRKAN